MSEQMKGIILCTLLIGTLITGIAGLCMGNPTAQAGNTSSQSSFADSLFNTLTMFGLNYTEAPSNILVNIARFLAAFFAIDAFIIIFKDAIHDVMDSIKGLRKNSIFLLGDTEEAHQFQENCDFPIIIGRDNFCKAGRYVLLGSDAENTAFYDKYSEQLADKPVYIRSSTFQRVITNRGLHTFFSIDEIAARKYWFAHSLMDIAFDDNNEIKPELNVVIYNMNNLGQEIVYQALQTNIFSAKQIINYHVFAQDKKFEHMHKHLSTLHVIVHYEPWYEAQDLLKTADRIILTGDNSIVDLEEILYCVTTTPIDILCNSSTYESVVNDHRAGKIHAKLSFFNISEMSSNPEAIMMGQDIEAAKELNLSWSGKDSSFKEELWLGLSAEKRYSNISCADYHVIRKQLLEKKKPGASVNWQEYMEELAELEHIRWENFYLFNNWDKLTDPEIIKNSTKDEARRLHVDVFTYYSTLSETEKEKDRVQIRKMFELDEIMKNKK